MGKIAQCNLDVLFGDEGVRCILLRQITLKTQRVEVRFQIHKRIDLVRVIDESLDIMKMGAEDDQQQTFVVVTSRRFREVTGPLDRLNGQANYIKINDKVGRLRGYICLLISLFRYTRSESPGAIVAINGGLVTFICLIVSVVQDTPLIVRIAGNRWETRKERFRAHASNLEYQQALSTVFVFLLERLAERRATGLIVVSKSLIPTAIHYTKFDASKVGVVHIPLDENSEHISISDSGVDEDEYSSEILTVTNLDYEGKYRGVRDGLNEISKYLHDNQDATYTVVGGGRYVDNLMRDVGDLDGDVRSRINIVGNVDDVAHYYSKSDVFVYVSYRDAYPNVIIEAQYFGLPIISVEKFGMVEQIEHGESGMLVKENRLDNIHQYLRQIEQDVELRNRLSKQARNKVAEDNSIHSISNEFVQAIRKIIS
ncbi:glycosyltransferase family 4 protein [Halomarina rubra]|uniref:Glycosyltransferase family 4 protein n=1 Tax=Halomarina rubra TaxID=2071873 RepID=A0ABD6AXM4_9EURY|nr:glycosyltransferase family 4 protein [Halomarina rubra]